MKDKNDNTISNISNLEKSIKSLYIIKYIFSFLDDTKKLILINYNKHLQNKLNIDIEYYKVISGKYKIYENNGKGKEFILGINTLIFEGQYKTGKRNGKGKEYYENGNLKFEGEYLNNKRWKGIGYNIKGKIALELDNGKGKEYYGIFGDKDKIKFEGKFLGEKIWNGKIYNYNGNEEFEIKDGKGFIKEFDNEGNVIYEGEYLNGKRNGKGKEYFLNLILRGWQHYDWNPNFKKEYEPIFRYRFNLFGKESHSLEVWEDTARIKFEGEQLNGKRWKGKGYNYFRKEEFEIMDGKGFVREYDNKGALISDGKYNNGKMNGTIREYNVYRETIFFGEYKNGKRNGEGEEYNNEGKIIFKGEYLNGFRNKGKFYDNEGKLIFEGECLNGLRIERKFYDNEGKLIFIDKYLPSIKN